jgi:hypothetical protein
VEKNRTETNANIYWTRDSIPVVLKNLIGLEAEQYAQKYGDDLPNWNGARNEHRLAEKLDYLLPGGADYFYEHSAHTGSKNHKGPVLGVVAGSRGRNTFNLHELKRFRDNPQWRPIVELTEAHHASEKPIETYHRYAAHEKMLLMNSFDQAGVYLNQSAETPEWFYLGTSKNISSRNKGHRNSDFYLIRVYPTVTGVVATMLESSLHERIIRSGLVKTVRNPERPVGKQGAYRLADGCNPLVLLDSIVNTDYKEFCRGTIGLNSSATQPNLYEPSELRAE